MMVRLNVNTSLVPDKQKWPVLAGLLTLAASTLMVKLELAAAG